MTSTTIASSGAPLGHATAVMIMMHGRGASAKSMLEFAELLARRDISYLAPQTPAIDQIAQRIECLPTKRHMLRSMQQ
jgi:hypothetical protein